VPICACMLLEEFDRIGGTWSPGRRDGGCGWGTEGLARTRRPDLWRPILGGVTQGRRIRDSLGTPQPRRLFMAPVEAGLEVSRRGQPAVAQEGVMRMQARTEGKL
jgi:hypothetical protein